MRWILRLVEQRADARSRCIDVAEIARRDSLGDIADLGLTLTEAKQLLAKLQRALVEVQADRHAALRPNCRSCGEPCGVKDSRMHRIATLFGSVTVRFRRSRYCRGCGHIETGLTWPSYCRSAPELEQLQAHLSALLPYQAASALLQRLLPLDAGKNPETLRSHTLAVGERLSQADAIRPTVVSTAITVTLDSTFIRGRGHDDVDRHLEVRVGYLENTAGQWQVLGAVTHAKADITSLIRRGLENLGRSKGTVATAFTGGVEV